ncbi:MAG: GNAT family N-acetyltransferase [Lachnospiraceae bacterium]|nr:GNAT family N-acetyltransferase [Lachnospiraceae bacterium]
MQLRVLKNDEIARCEAFDPFGLLKEACLAGYHLIGAFEREDDEAPAGVILVEKAGETLNIRWLYVDEEKRGKCTGEALLAGTYRIALTQGLKKIGAELPSFKGREDLCEGEEYFLNERYFEDEKPLYAQWRFKYKDVSEKEKFREALKSAETKGEMVTLSSLSGAKRQNAITDISKNKYGVIRHAILNDYSTLDLDASILFQQNGTITGAAIFERAGDDIWLSGFVATSKSHVSVVLAKALERCNELIPDATIHIKLERNIYYTLMTEVLGKPISGKILYADPISFIADQADEEYEGDFTDTFIDGLFETEE